MPFPPKWYLVLFFAPLVFSGSSLAARRVVVSKISINPNGPVELNVRTSAPATPQAQVISNPERLVIDVPGAIPGAGLHSRVLNRSEVERVRVGLFSAAPPVTRIVLDLNSPQSYRIAPTASGFEVTLGVETGNNEKSSLTESAVPSNTESANKEPVIGWVSSSAASTSVAAHRDPFVVKKPIREPAKPALVEYASGQLEIHAHDAPLYDVLEMIKEQTGAEITVPPFTRDERVVGDFGPGTASEVLAQLLNGSNLNFVVLASPSNPSALQRVVLSLKPEGLAENAAADTSAQPENATPAENAESPPPVVEPRPEDIPQSQAPDTPAPAPDQPQN